MMKNDGQAVFFRQMIEFLIQNTSQFLPFFIFQFQIVLFFHDGLFLTKFS